jgi:PAS domain S-box-containing protein
MRKQKRPSKKVEKHRGRPAEVEASQSELELKERHDHLEELIAQRTRELAESEARYRELLEHAPAGIYQIDPKTRRFIEVNDAMCRLLGYGREELLLLDPEELLDQDGRKQFRERMAAGLAGEKMPAEIEYKVKGRNGREFWAVLNTSVNYEKGKPRSISVIAHEITGRRRVEQALRESETKYRIIADHTYNWEFWLAPDGRFLYCSPSCERITGHAAKEFLADPSLRMRLIHPDDRGRFAAHMNETGRVHAVKEEEWRFVLPDGSYRWVAHICQPVFDETGVFLGIRGSNRDITQRKQTEEALHRKQAELQVLLDNTPAGLVLFDAKPPYNVLTHNCYYQQLFGEPYRSMGMVGLNVYDYAPEVEASGVVAVFDEVVRTAQPKHLLDFPYQSDPPKQSWFNWHMLPLIIDGQVVALVSMSIDVTERHQAEKALRESEENLKRAQSVGNIGNWRLDIRKNELTWSDENHRVFGIPKGTPLTYERFLSAVHPDDRAYVDTKWKSGMAGEGYDIEHRIIADGKIKWVREKAYLEFDEKGSLVAGFGITQDITVRKGLEEELKKHNEALEERVRMRTEEVMAERKRFFDVLETLPAMVCLLSPDHYVAFANRAFRERFGESHGRHCYQYCFGEEGPCRFCESYRVLETGEPHHWECNAPDGSIMDVYDFPFIDTDGSALILEMDIDITEYRKAQKGFLDAQAELERAKRLSDIGVLAATVAHELRNPLAAIKLAAVNLKRKAKNPVLDRHLATIDKKVAESDQFINNLLFYSHLRPPDLEKVSILDVLEESIGSAEDNSGKGISIVRNTSSLRNLSIEADPFQIKELFVNILNNAHDAVRGDRREIRIDSEFDGEHITISIEDNGPGIADDVMDKVFDPFFTTKAKGTGLGLSVCKQIVSMHDGEIAIKPGTSGGTRVVVRLPMARKNGRAPGKSS